METEKKEVMPSIPDKPTTKKKWWRVLSGALILVLAIFVGYCTLVESRSDVIRVRDRMFTVRKPVLMLAVYSIATADYVDRALGMLSSKWEHAAMMQTTKYLSFNIICSADQLLNARLAHEYLQCVADGPVLPMSKDGNWAVAMVAMDLYLRERMGLNFF